MWHGGIMYGHDGWFGWGGLMGILVIVLVIIAVVFIVKSVAHNNHLPEHKYDHLYDGHEKEGDALKILRERFAKGDITEEKFNQMKETLEKE